MNKTTKKNGNKNGKISNGGTISITGNGNGRKLIIEIPIDEYSANKMDMIASTRGFKSTDLEFKKGKNLHVNLNVGFFRVSK